MFTRSLHYFFTYFDDLPADAGFKLVGPAHLLWLGLIAAGCFWAWRAYQRTAATKRPAFQKCMAFFALGLEVLKDLLLLRDGALTVWALPLHLCGITMLVVIIHSLRPNKTTSELLYSLGLLGVVAALLFPDWTIYPPFNLYSIQSFAMHGVLLAYILMLMTAKELRPNYRQLWRPALFLMVGLGPIYWLNSLWGTNFWFINWASEGSPLVPLQQLFGRPGYIFAAVGLLLVVWFFMYLPYILKDARNSPGKSRAVTK